jgi:hypothetical protein
MAGPYYTNTKVDNVDFIEAADLEAIETGFSNVDSDKANKKLPATANNLAALDSNGDLADSGKAYPTGTVVGTSDAQTLTNKTLDADTNTLSNVEVDNFKATAIVTEAEGLNSSDNDTSLPTTAAVKDYVDNQVGANNELSEILANGNTTGANDLQINNGQALKTNVISETTLGAGVTIDSVLLKDDVVNATDIETGSISANDGTTSATIADSTGVMTIASSVLTTTDINGGTIDAADITVGAGKTLDVSAGTLTLANDQISGDKVEGGTINATTITTLTSTTVNATTVDSTNLEVTNLKAKDGTAAGSIANSTGVTTLNSAVLTTADINGGTIDGATIGGSSAAAGTFTTVTSTSDSEFNGVDVGRGAGNVPTNTAVGASALAANTTGSSNVAIGYEAALNNTTDFGIVAVGRGALYSNTTGDGGSYNVAVGMYSMYTNTTGYYNVAVGRRALYSNTTGDQNAAFGQEALYSNTTASNNTAVGYQALYSNTTGAENVAIGYQALRSNTTGSFNTALGRHAGYDLNNTNGRCVFVGYNAGANYTTGAFNTAIGQNAGELGTTGSYNTYIGQDSGTSITTGSKNTIIGRYNGNQGGLDIRTSSNYIVLSDGDGNRRITAQGSSVMDLMGTPSAGLSNSLFKIVNRGTGNSSETFTSTDMGMNDNVTALINISIGGKADTNHYGGCLIYWYMPLGGNSVIHQTIVPAFKGVNISTFSVAASGNSLVVTKDTDATVSITVIGGGGRGVY